MARFPEITGMEAGGIGGSSTDRSTASDCDTRITLSRGTRWMSLDHSDIAKIAHLARLAIDEDKVAAYAMDLSNILDLVEQLEAVDAEDVLPMAHPLHMTQRLRPDEVTEENHRGDYQRVAPQVEAGLYLVPKVIE
jgi:aspartyl-tRNA(Asn)/glutamyl-tRNA(Gln) amidotransferase subunit C